MPMTIADAAKLYGVTQQAVYQKLKRKGIKRSDIQQAGTAELTKEGEEIIASLFKSDQSSIAQQALKNAQEIIELNQQLQTATQSLKEKTEEAEAYKQKIAQLEQDVSLLRDQLKTATEDRDFLRMTLSQTIEANKIAIAALQPSMHEKGLLARIKARFARKEKTE